MSTAVARKIALRIVSSFMIHPAGEPSPAAGPGLRLLTGPYPTARRDLKAGPERAAYDGIVVLLLSSSHPLIIDD
jgi:hypothetical protein